MEEPAAVPRHTTSFSWDAAQETLTFSNISAYLYTAYTWETPIGFGAYKFIDIEFMLASDAGTITQPIDASVRLISADSTRTTQQPIALVLASTDGADGIDANGTVTVRVSLSAWKQSGFDLDSVNGLSVSYGTFASTDASIDADAGASITSKITSISLNEIDPEYVAPVYPPLVEFLPHIAAGRTAWCYDDPAKNIVDVQLFNASMTNDAQKLRALFVYAGSIDFTDGKPTFSFNKQQLIPYLREFSSSQVQIVPNIDAFSAGAELVSDCDWKIIATRIVVTMELFIAETAELGIERPYGYHFNIEPHVPSLHKLYSAIKTATNRNLLQTMPVSVSTSVMSAQTFKYCDCVVFMIYDLIAVNTRAANRLSRYRNEFRGVLRKAATSAELAAHAKLIAGIPAAATFAEYEHRTRTDVLPAPSGAPLQSDFVTVALEEIERLRDIYGENQFKENARFLGECLWAFKSDTLATRKKPVFYHFPASVAGHVIDALKK